MQKTAYAHFSVYFFSSEISSPQFDLLLFAEVHRMQRAGVSRRDDGSKQKPEQEKWSWEIKFGAAGLF